MRSFAIPLATALLPTMALASDVRAPSRIDSVVVYLSSARVTRTARIELPAGDVRVLIEGATPQLDDDSLRVDGKGSARVKIFGASIEQMPRAEAASPEVRAAQDKMAALEERDRALEDALQAAKARREFVDSLRATYVRERTENLPVRSADAKEWAAMADFVAKQLAAIQDETRKADSSRRELAKQLQAARAELAKLQAKAQLATKTIAVDLHVERAGAFELEASYLVPAASWHPLWDARLDADKQSIDLALYGSVQQTTGEDWSDVKLALSTAQPWRGLTVPELDPIYVDRAPPPRPPQRGHYGAPGAAAPMAREMPSALADGYAAEQKLEEMERPAAAIVEGLVSTTFEAPRRETVDGTGRARKAFLAAFPLKAELARTSAPRREMQAYLTAVAKNSSGAMLLPGAVNVFLGDDFIGRAALGSTPDGSEVKLAFGADDRVKIDRTVQRVHETAGLFTKEDVYTYRVRTTVKNLYARPVTATVLDQVPVSRDEKIEVKLLDASTKPTEPEDPMKPGVRVHKLSLGPKAGQVIDLVYEVRFPRGLALHGLE